MTTYPRYACQDDTWIINAVGDRLSRVHGPGTCNGQTCIIHNPSDHHMREWSLNWRQYDGLVNIKESHFERICPCGIGHPDPDDLEFHLEQGRDYMAIHGCCGCCHSEDEGHNA